MKKLVSITMVITIILSLFTVTASAATDWLKVGSENYYTVTLNDSVYSSYKTQYAKVKLESRNSISRHVSKARVHVKVTDKNGRWLSEFDTTSGSYLKLYNDNKTYRVYVSYYKSKGGIIESGNAFTDNGNDEWRLTSASKCSISSVKASSNKTTTSSNKTTSSTNKNTSTSSKPTLYEGTAYFISPKHTGTKCVIDTEGGNWSTHEGANALLWEYGNSNYNSRKYKAYHVGNGYYKIVNVNSGLVLDVNTSNLNVGHYKYHGGSNQLWRFDDAGNGYVYVISKWSKNGKTYVLDIHGVQSHNGANLEVCDINYGNNQRFKFWK